MKWNKNVDQYTPRQFSLQFSDAIKNIFRKYEDNLDDNVI